MNVLSRRAGGALLPVMLACGLAGCASRIPTISPPVLRTEAPVGALGGVPGATVAWPTPQWWQRYEDPILDSLEKAALEGAPSLATADARFAAAREAIRITGAAAGIQVGANASYDRQRLSDNGLFSPKFLGFNWYNDAELGVSASYTFDWWGRQRANIEAAVDQSRAAAAERAAAALAITGGVAEAYFGWQSDQLRLQLASERRATLQQLARVSKLRVDAQLDDPDNLHIATQSLEFTEEQISALQGSIHLHLVALAALLGISPEQLPALSPRPLPQVAQGVPENLKLDLIARRPDITASRWRVEAAQQELVAARTAYYPDISIHALAGLSSIEISRLLEGGSSVPAVGAAVHLPLFDSGLRGAQFAAQRAAVREAIALYDETVVSAAREVASALYSAQSVAEQRRHREVLLSEARAQTDSAVARVRAGTSDIRMQYVTTLALNVGQDGLIQFDLAALSADIALQRALGGGYTHTEETP